MFHLTITATLCLLIHERVEDRPYAWLVLLSPLLPRIRHFPMYISVPILRVMER